MDKALVVGSESLPSISETRKAPELKLTINQDLVLSRQFGRKSEKLDEDNALLPAFENIFDRKGNDYFLIL